MSACSCDKAIENCSLTPAAAHSPAPRVLWKSCLLLLVAPLLLLQLSCARRSAPTGLAASSASSDPAAESAGDAPTVTLVADSTSSPPRVETEVRAEAEPITVEGVAQGSSKPFDLEPGLCVVTFLSDTPLSLQLESSSGDVTPLSEGATSGSRAVGVAGGSYKIKADVAGAWSATITAPRPQPDLVVPKSFSGAGPSATPLFYLSRGPHVLRLRHDGDGKFIVWLLNDRGGKAKLLAEGHGDFEGQQDLEFREGGAGMIDVAADGEWSVVFE